jgi:6-pyruvoyltetrahydropterin/6-carboxytetrahydropterin synthase
MFSLFVKDTFAAAHRIDLYNGKCEELHGHNFRVEALFEGENLGKEGMLVDFAVLKAHLRQVISDLDHKYINEIPFFNEKASSSEYLALYIYNRLKELIDRNMIAIVEVRVWESENAYASYRE